MAGRETLSAWLVGLLTEPAGVACSSIRSRTNDASVEVLQAVAGLKAQVDGLFFEATASVLERDPDADSESCVVLDAYGGVRAR